jgi:hypothetical protein
MYGVIRLSAAEDETSENIYDLKTANCDVSLKINWVQEFKARIFVMDKVPWTSQEHS